MADKPKTYAMQVQELKQQLEDKDTIIQGLQQDCRDNIPNLQVEVERLKAELELRDKADMQKVSTSKASMNDLEQRALSAEQGNRNAQTAYKNIKAENEALQQQLDIIGAELDKNRGKDDKINRLAEELQFSNNKIAAQNQQLKDAYQTHNEAYAKQEKEIIYLRELVKAQASRLAEVTAAIQAAPDIISGLKGMISRW